MSLQVWLNTHNNIENHGVGTMSITPSGTPSYIDGKLGKCFITGDNRLTIPWDSLSEELTIALWVYPKSPAAWTDIFALGEKDNRFEVNKTNEYYWFCDDNTVSLIESGTDLFGMKDLTWHHITMTINGTNICFFIDGTKIKEVTQKTKLSKSFGTNKNIYIGSRKNGGCRYAGYMSDIRIYDDVLSEKEINEISKGLACHYPLNDIYSTTSINKYSGEFFNGRTSNYNSGDTTVTKLQNERGYNYKYSYTGTGGNCWKTFYFPVFSFTAGKSYDYSCKIRCNSCTSNVVLALRASRIGNDWASPKQENVCTFDRADGKWKEYHFIITLEDKTDRGGTIYDTKPLLEFYTSNMQTKDALFSLDFDLKNVQVSECNTETPASNGGWNDKIVYDISGNNSHGSIVSSTAPSICNDSLRYSNCYKFNGASNYLSTINPLHSGSTNFSIACWVKFLSANSQTIYTARTTVGGGISIFLVNSKIRLDDNALGLFDYDMTNHINNWTHICTTRDTVCKKLYINGKLVSTLNAVGNLANIGKHGTIGASEREDSGVGSDNYLNGYLSDFRIYTTTLSTEDIKQLYEIPVSLTNNGTLLTQGEYVED